MGKNEPIVKTDVRMCSEYIPQHEILHDARQGKMQPVQRRAGHPLGMKRRRNQAEKVEIALQLVNRRRQRRAGQHPLVGRAQTLQVFALRGGRVFQHVTLVDDKAVPVHEIEHRVGRLHLGHHDLECRQNNII